MLHNNLSYQRGENPQNGYKLLFIEIKKNKKNLAQVGSADLCLVGNDVSEGHQVAGLR